MTKSLRNYRFRFSSLAMCTTYADHVEYGKIYSKTNMYSSRATAKKQIIRSATFILSFFKFPILFPPHEQSKHKLKNISRVVLWTRKESGTQRTTNFHISIHKFPHLRCMNGTPNGVPCASLGGKHQAARLQ